MSKKNLPQKPKNPGGRPKILIDIEQAKSLCRIGCTRDEICDFLEVDDETLSSRLKEAGYDSFSTFYKKHSAAVKVSVRRYQLKAAAQLQPSILIWLGKQCLGQKERSSDNDKSPFEEKYFSLLNMFESLIKNNVISRENFEENKIK